GDRKELRHTARHSGLGNLAALLGLEPADPPADPLAEAFDKWGVPQDDLHANSVAKRLTKLWTNWSHEQRRLLLKAADCVAKAEKLKLRASKTPRTQKRRHVTRCAIDAAKVAQVIARLFPPPWKGDRAPIGDVVDHLGSFMVAALRANADVDQAVASAVAR